MPKSTEERIIDRPYDLSLRRGASSSSSSGGSGGGTGATTLGSLTDVALTGLTDGEGLVWSASSSKWVNMTLSGGGGAPSPHALSGPHHNGALDWSDIDTTGSSLTDIDTRSHGDLQGVTANQHHNQAHVLATNSGLGADHTMSGATAGHVLRASSGTDAAFAQLQHSDLGGVTANQHHNQQHAITGSDHTVTGSAFDVIGLSGTNALAVLTPSSNPGAAAKLLRTDANGSIQFDTSLLVVDAANDLVTIDTNLFYADVDNRRIGVNKTPGGATLDMVAYSNADHTQRIKQKSGQTGRLWRIEDTSGNELIVLDSQGNLQSGSPGFYSGLTGWQITPTGTAEFNNVWVRGELHASVFVKDEVHISGGTLLVTTGAKLYSDAEIDSTTVDTETLQFEQGSGLEDWEVEQGAGTEVLEVEAVFNYIEIEDSPTGPGFYFDEGEVVRSKTEVDTGITDFWFTVAGGVQMDGYQRYSVLKQSGTDGTLPAGAGLASYKQEGDGLIMLTSDLNYAPYMDVFTVGPNVWSGAAGAIVPHVRVGRLDGVGVTAVSGIKQYGIIAGTDLSNANSPYLVASNLQLGLYRVNLTLNDGTNDTGQWTAEGNLTIGTNIGTTNGKSFQVITTGDDAGDVIIGRLAGEHMHWDQSTATLTINGALDVGGGTLATEAYADAVAATAQSTAISTAASDATTKANTAQSNANSYTDGVESGLTTDIATAKTAAQLYGNSRRVVGVSGTWAPASPPNADDTITWTSVSVRFGDGTTKSVTNGNTGNMGATSYLYVDTTASAPLTMGVTTSSSSLGDNHVLIAVASPGNDKSSVIVVGGRTYISGGDIATGSILAANIKAATITATEIAANAITATQIQANAVTASKINVSTLSAIQTDTGSLSVTGNIDVGATGAIRGNTKAYGSATAGFFLGYHSSAYKLDVGDANNYMRWDGSDLVVQTDNPLRLRPNGSNDIISLSRDAGVYTGTIKYMSGDKVVFSSDAEFTNKVVTAEKFDSTGDTFRLQTERVISSYTDTGLKGEICWGIDGSFNEWLYVCIATNFWRRIPLPTTTW